MRRQLIKSASLVILLVVIQAQASHDIKLGKSVTNKTDTQEITISISESAKKTRLQVKANVQAGMIKWTLRDPDGNTRLTINGSGGRVSGDTGDMAPVQGTWTLVMEFKNATLDYEIDWVSR
jgi:hypothetical protein